MSLTIDLNTIIFVCGQIVTLVVLLLSVRNTLRVLTDRMEKAESRIEDLYCKHSITNKELGIIQGVIQ